MENMACDQFERILEQQPDPLPALAETHLRDCARCQLLWSDLETIHRAAQEWAAAVPDPPDRLWASLQIQLQAEGLIRQTPQPAGRSGWFSGWLKGSPRLATAGAYLSLVLLGAILLGIRMDSPVKTPKYGAVISSIGTTGETDLARVLDNDMKSVMAALPEHNPSLATSLQENLGIVDNMIALCEKSVREQPDDPLAREYLYGAYEQKAVLLATALDRSTLEEK